MKIENIKLYLRDSFNELKKVNWLSRKESINLTIEILIFSLIFVVLYGILDSLFVKLLFLIS